MAEVLRIGGAAGFWGDASMATPQLLAAGSLDFLVYDYLAEITMAILARARTKDRKAGYATDFVKTAMAPNLAEIARQRVRVVSNAGGVNPRACADALRREIATQGLSLNVAVVEGDDLLDRAEDLAGLAPRDMFSGAPFPAAEKIASINAYLGAFPVAAALDRGADIVITGRCVDSAVTLGACIHHFGWKSEDLDKLAGGSLAGHILECGPQATGGNFTDWKEVAEGMARIGYPIAGVRADGTFDVTKPANTGGIVSRGTVSEQLLYEIGDPQAYLLPDVVCDFSGVVLTGTGPDRVHVSGARGLGVPESCKICVTWEDGYRAGHYFTFYGLDAEAKAQGFAEAALARARKLLDAMGAPEFTHTSVELIGAESQFGALRHSGASREVAAKIAVRHPDAGAVGLFLKEAVGLGLSAPPGLSGFAGARPKPSPVLALHSSLLPKAQVEATVRDSRGVVAVEPAGSVPVRNPELPAPPALPSAKETVEVPLIRLAWARSGDKGDIANIGVIARQPNFMPWIWAALDETHLRSVFGHFWDGEFERFYLPGSQSMNILLHGALGGGGTSSLRNDPQAKGYAQLLLAAPVQVDADLMGGHDAGL
ncbi:acyclic terpene utilization AtuA family protein [Leisingera sp. ANG-Vp]|uniref:acyclic terpene utilization AtuA family protein n=1 Tax=Leisingera sp. ANG-Vp TaxID=1577896 RepID=UPI00057E9F90|nr:acyclic terpene utilization AtuA family protein [Leisingera sp. ANG-Vp]KIC16946.1 terpene utilization protein AtuA [Leisingera sp. ANG-Vp]